MPMVRWPMPLDSVIVRDHPQYNREVYLSIHTIKIQLEAITVEQRIAGGQSAQVLTHCFDTLPVRGGLQQHRAIPLVAADRQLEVALHHVQRPCPHFSCSWVLLRYH